MLPKHVASFAVDDQGAKSNICCSENFDDLFLVRKDVIMYPVLEAVSICSTTNSHLSDSECVSAEIRELDGGKVNLRDTRNVALCHLSSTCDNAQASSEKTDNAGWYLYHKV